jgi:hypothetical protein
MQCTAAALDRLASAALPAAARVKIRLILWHAAPGNPFLTSTFHLVNREAGVDCPM